MKLVTAEEMAYVDRTAIQEYGIPGIVLMENAGLMTVLATEERFGSLGSKRVIILAGKGNNGGDGFVVARQLMNRGADVEAFLLASADAVRGDARINLLAFQKMGGRIFPLIGEPPQLDQLKAALAASDLIVDALYGTGFRGPLPPLAAQVVDLANESGLPIVAIDIPSGVHAGSGRVVERAIQANLTVSFALPKLGLVLEPGASHVGELRVVDISIPREVLTHGTIPRSLLTPELVRPWLPPRAPDAHKGTFGHMLVIGGSPGMAGAPSLAAAGALKCGAGLVTIACGENIQSQVARNFPEIMTFPLPVESDGTLGHLALDALSEWWEKATAIVVGPGLKKGERGHALLRGILERAQCPLLIDADGLNLLADMPEPFCPSRSDFPVVLTPHPGEMARLMGVTTAEIQADRLGWVLQGAKQFGAVVTLKGQKTLIAHPDGSLYVNPTGNPGMASGGTGDVLAGAIGALLAQGMEAAKAAALGAYIHGLAGDLGAEDWGMISLSASDLIADLPNAWKTLDK